MAEVLKVTSRKQVGSRACRRLRHQDQIPAVLYGHGLETVHLTVVGDDLRAALRHGSKLLDLQGDVNESAFLQAVQWDCYGNEVLHVDLARVSAEEAVAVTLAVDLIGEAPGTKEGGVVELMLHDLRIECPAGRIPDKLHIKIQDLHLGQTIHAGDVTLPEGASLITPADAVVVHCVKRLEVTEEAAAAQPAEPEVIGRKPSEDEEEE